MLRILTRLVPLEAATLDAAATERLIFSIMTAEQQTRVRERREVDISYALPCVGRFRINVFRQRDSVLTTPLTLDARGAKVEVTQISVE